MPTLIKFLIIFFAVMLVPFGNKAYGVAHVETITFETEDEFFEHIITEAILSVTPKRDVDLDLLNLIENDNIHLAFTSPFYSFFVDAPVHNFTHITQARIQFTLKF